MNMSLKGYDRSEINAIRAHDDDQHVSIRVVLVFSSSNNNSISNKTLDQLSNKLKHSIETSQSDRRTIEPVYSSSIKFLESTKGRKIRIKKEKQIKNDLEKTLICFQIHRMKRRHSEKGARALVAQ